MSVDRLHVLIGVIFIVVWATITFLLHNREDDSTGPFHDWEHPP